VDITGPVITLLPADVTGLVWYTHSRVCTRGGNLSSMCRSVCTRGGNLSSMCRSVCTRGGNLSSMCRSVCTRGGNLSPMCRSVCTRAMNLSFMCRSVCTRGVYSGVFTRGVDEFTDIRLFPDLGTDSMKDENMRLDMMDYRGLLSIRRDHSGWNAGAGCL